MSIEMSPPGPPARPPVGTTGTKNTVVGTMHRCDVDTEEWGYNFELLEARVYDVS